MGPPIHDLNSSRPFAASVDHYRKKLWLGTVPLPTRDKAPAPTGYTGHAAPHPSAEDIRNWLNEPGRKRANIGIRLAGVDAEHEIIGIDVDHYISGTGDKAKDKRGGDQLADLEKQLGALPATWRSSARTDGISGIRYYRIPRGFAFAGKAAKDIDIIYKGYRFACVWPSIHPNGNQYWWFPPNAPLTEEGRKVWGATVDDLPDARELTLLPQSWLDQLSAGGMKAKDNEAIDMTSTVNELHQWAEDTFNAGGTLRKGKDGHDEVSGVCSRVAKSMIQQQQKIKEDATSHDKITEIHWHFLSLASEAHLGWDAAIAALEKLWVEDVVERDKRGRGELRGEIFRSKINALRKIKANVDQRIAIGATGVDKSCPCRGVLHVVGTDEDGNAAISLAGDASTAVSVVSTGGSDGDDDDKIDFNFDNLTFNYVQRDEEGNIIVDDEGNAVTKTESDLDDDGLDPILRYVMNGPAKRPDEYEMNDDGNAQHFIDLFSPIDIGPVLRWVDGVGWLIWVTGGKDKYTDEIMEPHWEIDANGLIRRAWQMVKDRQMQFAEQLMDNYNLVLAALQAANPGGGPGSGLTANGTPAAGTQIMAQKKKAESWMEFARKSGNNQTANAAIEALKEMNGVTASINDFDANPLLLGVKNGVLDLSGNEVQFRPMRPDDYILLNTNVSYRPYDKFDTINKKDTGKAIWDNYLNTFINVGTNGAEFLEAVQMCLGYGLIGDNPQRVLLFIKGPSSTGKSTMLNAITAAVGDYAANVTISIYQPHKLNPMLAKALPKRFAMTSELSSDDDFSVGMVKNITGHEVITAELKGSNAIVERKPAFLPIIATNTTPTIDGADEALRRRLIVLPFENAVKEDGVDISATYKIENYCGEIVLSWLVEGYFKYKANGSKLPRENEILKMASDEAMTEFNPLGEFLKECIIKHPNSFADASVNWKYDSDWVISRDQMHTHYKTWCNSVGIREYDQANKIALGRKLSALGFQNKKIQTRVKNAGTGKSEWKSVSYWYGIKVDVKSILKSNETIVKLSDGSDADIENAEWLKNKNKKRNDEEE